MIITTTTKCRSGTQRGSEEGGGEKKSFKHEKQMKKRFQVCPDAQLPSFSVCLKPKQHLRSFGIIMHNRSGSCFHGGHPGAVHWSTFFLQVDGRCMF